MRGQADWDGPPKENPEYAPATNALPYLEKLAQELESPLMPFVYNWEHPGPWVQPDAFPPLGGEEAMREFMTKNPKKISGDALASEVMAIMKQYRIDEVPVVDNDNRPVGLIDVQDLVVLKMFDVEAAT